jgi:hypothetical protein
MPAQRINVVRTCANLLAIFAAMAVCSSIAVTSALAQMDMRGDGSRMGGMPARGDNGGGFSRGIGIGIGVGADIIGHAVEEGAQEPGKAKTDRAIRRGKRDEEKKRTGTVHLAKPDKEKPDKPGANNPQPSATKDQANPPKIIQITDDSAKRGSKRRHLTSVQVNDEGKELETKFIDCGGHKGKVSVHDGVVLTPLDENGKPQEGSKAEKGYISISYSGTACDDCLMLQFVWREIVLTWKGGKITRMDGVVRSSGQDFRLTTDAEHPIYKLDSASPINPSYEALGKANIDDNSLTIFDKPSPGNDMANFEKSKYEDIVQVDAIAHFDTFLICDGEVCAKVSWSVSDTWTQKDDTTTAPKYAVAPISTTDKPNIEQYGKVLERLAWILITRN